MQEIKFHYKFSDIFKRWLAENSPAAHLRLETEGIHECEVTAHVVSGAFQRCRLEFPTIETWSSADGYTPGFDRQVEAVNGACLVLDGHPDAVAAVKTSKISREALQPGAIILIPVKDIPALCVEVPCLLTRREAFMAEFRLPSGDGFRMDVDDIATWKPGWRLWTPEQQQKFLQR